MRKNRRLTPLIALLAVPLLGPVPGICACAGDDLAPAAASAHACCAPAAPAPAPLPACHAGDEATTSGDAFRVPACRCSSPAILPVEAALANADSFPPPGARAHPGSTDLPAPPQAALPATSPLGGPEWTRWFGWLAPTPGGGSLRPHLALHVIRI